MQNRTAIIDADVIVYRAGFAGQDSIHSVVVNGQVMDQFSRKAEANDFAELLALGADGKLSPIVETEIVPKAHSEVENILDVMIDNIVEQSGATDYICYLSGKTNFRTEAAKYQEYKANRKDSVKPVHYDFIREYIQEKHPVVISDNCEADDLCAMRLWAGFRKYRDTGDKLDCDQILCSIDKDLLNVSGWHYNISSREILWQEPEAADRHFALQLLTGDRVDNIAGLTFYSNSKKRVGPATANKLLGDAATKEEMYDAVCKAYEEFAGDDWHDKLNNSGLLLWMQREPEQAFDIDDWKGGLYD